MQEPFDIEVGTTPYAVFPEENDTFTVFKDGIEYVHIQKDGENNWLKLHPETEMPLFEPDEEVMAIGLAIAQSRPEHE